MALVRNAHVSQQIELWDIKDKSELNGDTHRHILPMQMTTQKLRGISLFTGAGGMDIGFAHAGVQVVVANDLVSYACDTYAANHPETRLLRGDIRNYLDTFSVGDADIIFGGPPCQGFSVAGKMNPDDERSQLIWTFLDVVERVQPQMFIMENVKALGVLEKWKHIRENYLKRARNMGYCCNYYLLNASDFGVSQNRERVFFIGSRKPYDSIDFERVLDEYREKPKTLRQLFATLPPVGSEGNPLTCTAKISLATNPVMRKSPYAGMIFNGMGRPLNLDAVSTTLPASMGGNKTPIVNSNLLADPSAHDWVSDYHSKLRDGVIEAHFAPAPEQLRRLTIVESAAIQSFPIDYKFCGTKSAIYTQIGNAVPCKLAECVAKAVLNFFYEGMGVKMKKEDVRATLYKALADAQKEVKRPKCGELIDYVLDNTHLTYKYVLVNALASKATDPSINALCLQKKSKLPGAYDARTICHKVLVQFEMTELGKALGGSNEPFLNKPARFTELSKTNAVRRGNDQSILNKLVDELPNVVTANEAYDGLVYAIKKLLAVKAEKESLTAFDYSEFSGNVAKLAIFIDQLLSENFEGEALTLAVAGLFELYMTNIADDYLVEVHPVNQSGASSKEVSDLDVYRNNILYIANELKDKPFTEQDIRHAADKVVASGKGQMNFIVGRHGGYNHDEIHHCVSEYLLKDFIINVVPVDYIVLTLLGLIGDDNIDIDYFVKYILEKAINTKFKEDTVAFIKNMANKHFGA